LVLIRYDNPQNPICKLRDSPKPMFQLRIGLIRFDPSRVGYHAFDPFLRESSLHHPLTSMFGVNDIHTVSTAKLPAA
jgi:hypothetical protein